MIEVFTYDTDRLVFHPGQKVAKDNGGMEWLRSSMDGPGTCWRYDAEATKIARELAEFDAIEMKERRDD